MKPPILKPALLVVLSAALSACDEEPLAVDASPSAHAARQASVMAHRDEIQALVDAQLAAWNSRDANAFAATYTEDAVFFDPIGNVAEGREGIRALHALLFAGPFAPSSETQVIVDIRPLTGTIVVVHLRAALRDYAQLPPGLYPTEPGVVRTTKTWVVLKRGGTWAIHTQHMAPIAPTS